MSNNWITTYTGKKFDYIEPHADQICIEDIAHHLSLICRYNGAIPEHYSVAQHSVLVSFLVPQHFALPALLHDAAEAYTGDIVRPLKRHPELQQVLELIETLVETAIRVKFDISYRVWNNEFIKKADTQALLIEKRELFKASHHHEWKEETHIANLDEDPREDIKISYMHPKIAEQMFLNRFRELTK